MSNILEAIVNAIEYTNGVANIDKTASNRMNAQGEGLEEYVKSIFANTNDRMTEVQRREAEQKVFCYTGNKSNPPDLMLIGHGDAIEVKKIEGQTGELALNSSHPKDKLYADNSKIKASCRQAENGWFCRDMLYTIGSLESKELKSLWFVYGDCFCASKEVYEQIENSIEGAVRNSETLELSETNELARIKKADPLGISTLRVRGMWHISNPMSYFRAFRSNLKPYIFELTAILKLEKYDSLPEISKSRLKNTGAKISQIKIKNPNNPIQDIESVLISYERLQ
jgi:NgoPII restriction endonuclease